MRSFTTTLAASLLLGSLQGPPFIMAEAAPARLGRHNIEKPKYYFPRHKRLANVPRHPDIAGKRQLDDLLNNDTPTPTSDDTSSQDDLVENVVPDKPSSTPQKSSQDDNNNDTPLNDVVPVPETHQQEDPDLIVGLNDVISSVAPVASAPAAAEDVVESIPAENALPTGLPLSSIVAEVTSAVEPVITPVITPVETLLSSVVEPVLSSVVEPVLSSVVEPVLSSVVQPVESVVQSAADPIITSLAEPILSSVVAPILSSVVAPILSSVVQPVESVIETAVPSLVSQINTIPSGVLPPALTSLLSDLPLPTSGVIPAPLSSLLSNLPLPSSGLPLPISTGALPTNVLSQLSSLLGTGAPIPTVTAPPVPVNTSDLPVQTPLLTIQPIGTDSLTSIAIASTILQQSSLPPIPTVSGIPSSMPRVIIPPQGIPDPPKDSVLVQIGFTDRLNYDFVVRTKDSANQIFEFLPIGVFQGLSIDSKAVVMNAIQPYDTAMTLGYITTLAMLYIPKESFDKLNMDIHTPVSPLYNTVDKRVNQLMSLINPSIPLLPGDNPWAGHQPGDDDNPDGSGKPNSGDPISGSGGSNTVKPTTVGFVLAMVGGVAAYGAAMFFVARRYRKRRAAHIRASSMSPTSDNYSDTSEGGPWMAGGRLSRGSSNESSNGRSVRTAQISAPVMAENSLGWN